MVHQISPDIHCHLPQKSQSSAVGNNGAPTSVPLSLGHALYLKKRILFPLFRSACSKIMIWNSCLVQCYTWCGWNFGFVIVALPFSVNGRLWMSSGKLLHNSCHRQAYSAYLRYYITSNQDLLGSYLRRILLGWPNQEVWNGIDVLHG
jgi:hypothetical protein